MAVSVKCLLMSGISVVGATAIAVAPVHAPPPDISTSHEAAPVRVVSDEYVELLAAVQPVTATADPVPLNAAGDAIINAWDRALPWIDYWVELAAYAADFIPFGYFIPIGFEISAQIDIFYFTLIRPIANSFVVDLVAPVVDDPLNLDSYIDGLSTLGSVTWNSLQNFVIEEFNFFFGWLIPPLPPIPPLQSAAEEPMTAISLATTEDEAETAAPEGAEEAAEETVEAEEAQNPAPEAAEATEEGEAVVDDIEETEEVTEVDEIEDVEETPETGPTKSTNGTVTAQGEVRGSGVDATDATAATAVDDEATEEPTDGADDTSPRAGQVDAGDVTDTQETSDDAGDGTDAGDGGQD